MITTLEIPKAAATQRDPERAPVEPSERKHSRAEHFSLVV
jgi:hypothetical protein